MKIRDAGALRKKALDVQQKLDVSHFLPCFTMIYQHPGILEMVILWPLVTGWKPGPMPFVGVVPQLLALFCQGVICYHTILIWFNHMYISTGLHIYVVNVRVHPSISIHGCTKSQLFKGGICRDLPRWWVSAYPWSHQNVHGCCDCGTRPVLEMFWDASLGVLFWDVMYHVHVHQVSIRSWKSSPKYLHTEAKKVFAWLVSCKWCFLAEFEEYLQLHENQLTILLF